MAPRHPNTNPVPAGRKRDTHNQHFVAAYRSSRAIREFTALVEGGVDIPTYDYQSGPTTGLCFGADQVRTLNGLNLTHETACELLSLGRYNPESSYKEYENMLSAWANIDDEIGLLESTDKSQKWDIYDLLDIETIARSDIRYIGNALNRHARQVAMTP